MRKARSECPDLILMDVMLPGIDGFDATRILNADADTQHIPIIALTAHALTSDARRAAEAGSDGYLAKPCEPRRFAAKVERRIGSPAG